MTDTTKFNPGDRVRVVHAKWNYWNPDGLTKGDEGFISRLCYEDGELVDFKRDDGRMYRGLAFERFQAVVEEEKPSSFSRVGWPEMPEEIREDLHGPWSPEVNKAYWHGRAVSDAWAEIAIERLKSEQTPRYKFTFLAEKSYRDQTRYSVLSIPVTTPVSVVAETNEKAVELALQLLPKTTIPGHFWSLDVREIEVLV